MQKPQELDVLSKRVRNWLVAEMWVNIKGTEYARDDGLYTLAKGGVVVGIRHQRIRFLAVNTSDAQARINKISQSFKIDASFLEVLKPLYLAEVLLDRDAWPVDDDHQALFDVIDWSQPTSSITRLAPELGDHGDVRSTDTEEVA